MKIFSFFKRAALTPVVFNFQGRDKIWEHVSLPKEQYEKSYLETLRRFSDDHETIIALRLAEYSLRARRAYIIPAGVAPEDDWRTRDQWTYVCFVMSLACSIGYIDDTEDARQWMVKIVPVYVLRWLDRDVGMTMLQTIRGNFSDSFQLRKIIDYSQNIVFSGRLIEAERVHPTVDTAPMSTAENRSVESVNDEFILNDFLNKLTSDIMNKTVRVNLATASVHATDEGFVIYKPYIENYANNLPKRLSYEQCVNQLISKSENILCEKYVLMGTKIDTYFKAVTVKTPLREELGIDISWKVKKVK